MNGKPKPQVRLVRVLLYNGPEDWLSHTMKHNAVIGGVRGHDFSIQELVLPRWLGNVLAWFAKRAPMAGLAWHGPEQY